MIDSTTKKQASSLMIGVRVLAVIVFTEAAIMAGFHLLAIDPGSALAGVLDTLLLAAVSTAVIYLWVIRPLKRAKQQNDMFAAMVNHTDVGMVATDPQAGGAITYVNPAFTTITGYRVDQAIGRHPRFLQGDDVDAVALEQTRTAMREGRSTRVLQRNQRRDGTGFWNDLHLNPIVAADGTIRQWVGLINDVTAQRELERQNANWASAMQQSDEAVCVFDEQGVIAFANESFCDNVGMTLTALVGSDVRRFCAANDVSVKEISVALQNQQSLSGRHQCLRADGSSYEALSSMTPIEQPDGRLAFVAVHRDISDMVMVEAELRQSQKMEAVGMLVGGIAHDFNNVLAGLLGNLFLVKRHLESFPDLQKRIERVEEQGYAAAGMVRQLLSFSRKSQPDVKVLDLVPFCRELVKFARVSVPENVTLECQVHSDQLMVRCDPVQLQQSLLNLIVNATHALSEGHATGDHGEIILVVEAGCPLNNDATASASYSWGRVAVRDNGKGMDAETQERMFEPFFTTKGSDVGTGLGLAMVQNYVESLHGQIDVFSEPGKGTCLNVWLPTVADECAADVEQESQLRAGNGELLLIADDDKTVLEALSTMLEGANYRVLQACSGDDALRLFGKHEKELDMAILDMVMPKGMGSEVASAMQNRRRGLPIVFMTGYDRENTLPSHSENSLPVLQKPWDIARLNQLLEQSLG
ncbi:MAG: PAS domain S-box protein [Mariprofundus sp.]